jgi:hypothetical protein
MSISFFKTQLSVLVVAIALVITLAAWKKDRHVQTLQTISDTLPKQDNKKVKDLDEVVQELDKIQVELERSLNNIPSMEFDAEKMKAEIEKSMKDINQEKLELQVDQAMKQVDMEKVKAQMELAIKQIDREKIKLQMNEAMKDLDAQKLRLDVQEALAKVDMEKLKVQLEDLKKVELPKIEVELKEIKPQIEKALDKAKQEIEKTKQDIKEYKSFEDALEKDGLINKRENYSIEHREGQLTINGKVQPQAVYNKYSDFLKKHKQFKWNKSEGELSLDKD